MTEKKDKAETQPKAEKKPAIAKTVSAKTATPAKVATAKSPAAQSAKKSNGQTLTVQQVGSPIGRQGYQRATLIGLGLNKMMRTRTLEDTPSVRGMIESVKHLVKVVE